MHMHLLTKGSLYPFLRVSSNTHQLQYRYHQLSEYLDNQDAIQILHKSH